MHKESGLENDYLNLMESQEKIIVFDAYDTVIKASLVKTKLDAYGIPCFLTEENFTSWYPFRNDIFPGVRLHIFEKDADRVKELLDVNHLDADPILCTNCNSKNVLIEDTAYADGWYLLLAVLIFTPPRKANRKIYHCHDCGNKWE
jgi:hypothetical protein